MRFKTTALQVMVACVSLWLALGLVFTFTLFETDRYTIFAWNCAADVDAYDPYICFGTDILKSTSETPLEFTVGPLLPWNNAVDFTFTLQRATQREFVEYTVDKVKIEFNFTYTFHDVAPLYPAPLGDGSTPEYTGNAVTSSEIVSTEIHCAGFYTSCDTVELATTVAPQYSYLTVSIFTEDVNVPHRLGTKLFRDASVSVAPSSAGGGKTRMGTGIVSTSFLSLLIAFMAFFSSKTGLSRYEYRCLMGFLCAGVLASLSGVVLGGLQRYSKIAFFFYVIGIGSVCLLIGVVMNVLKLTLKAYREKIVKLALEDRSSRAISSLATTDTVGTNLNFRWRKLFFRHGVIVTSALVPAFLPPIGSLRLISFGLLGLYVVYVCLGAIAQSVHSVSPAESAAVAKHSRSYASLSNARSPTLSPPGALPPIARAYSSSLKPSSASPPSPSKPPMVPRNRSVFSLLAMSADAEDESSDVDNPFSAPFPVLGPQGKRSIQIGMARTLVLCGAGTIAWLVVSMVLFSVASFRAPVLTSTDPTMLFLAQGTFGLIAPILAISILCDERVHKRGCRPTAEHSTQRGASRRNTITSLDDMDFEFKK